MERTQVRRFAALGTFGVLGVACAFLMGATAGTALDGHVRSISVARIPVASLQAAAAQARHPSPARPAPIAIANK